MSEWGSARPVESTLWRASVRKLTLAGSPVSESGLAESQFHDTSSTVNSLKLLNDFSLLNRSSSVETMVIST
jgi:hypothetical protein